MEQPEQLMWKAYESRQLDFNEASRLFDRLEPIEPYALIGMWRGYELFTGHPLDGWLTKFGWYGKNFHSLDKVDPLLFRTPIGPLPLHPFFPAAVWNRLSGAQGTARLREMKCRGKVSTAMVYDYLPICDHFRKVNKDVVMGMMDWKGMQRPYFFLLARVYT